MLSYRECKSANSYCSNDGTLLIVICAVAHILILQRASRVSGPAPNECQNFRRCERPRPFWQGKAKNQSLAAVHPLACLMRGHHGQPCVFFSSLRDTASSPRRGWGLFFRQHPVTGRESASAQHGRVFLYPPAPIRLPWRARTEIIGSIRVRDGVVGPRRRCVRRESDVLRWS